MTGATGNPRLRIFLCSTKLDLDHERSAVSKFIQLSKHDEISMELFGAQPDAPIRTCLAQVASCDLMIVIVAYRYGKIVPRRRLSYSETEYRHGYKLRKPCFVYMPKKKPRNKAFIEFDENAATLLERWKEILERRHTIYFYNDVGDLMTYLGTNIPDWIAGTTRSRPAAESDSAYLAKEQNSRLIAVWVYAPHPLETLSEDSHSEIRQQVARNLLAGVRYVYFVESNKGIDRIACFLERLAAIAPTAYAEALSRMKKNVEVCILDQFAFLTHYTVHIDAGGKVEVYQSVLEPDRRDRIEKLSPETARKTYANIKALLQGTEAFEAKGLTVRKRMR